MRGKSDIVLDIHCHLLAGVDDGAEDLEEACIMARLAWDTGTKGLVVTPHSNVPDGFQNPWSVDLSRRIDEFREALVNLKNPIQVMAGMEVFGSDDVAAKIASRSVITLNASRYILLEFWTDDRPVRVKRVLESVSDMGLVPVIAHPERYAFIQENIRSAEEWAAKGYLLQLNKGSILGSFGRQAFHAAHALLTERLAHVVASDGHSPYKRVPTLSEAYEYISNHYSRSYAESLLRQTPGKIVNNK
jgi:protein-tyrosine phosphatase